MNKSTLIILSLALVSCAKEHPDADLRVEVTCKRCSVTITTSTMAIKDTIHGRLVYGWVGGEATVDTVPQTAAYNLKVATGAYGEVRACSLDTAPQDVPPSIVLAGAYNLTTAGGQCASFSYP